MDEAWLVRWPYLSIVVYIEIFLTVQFWGALIKKEAESYLILRASIIFFWKQKLQKKILGAPKIRFLLL